jgi:hypothetical protein
MSRFRMPAVFCAITFMLCEAMSQPYAEMGVCDDWSYVRTAQLLVQTGHIHYNGWAATLIGWQLYPAAILLKLFGFSFTASRASTFLVGVVTTFLIERTFVRAGINEQNAMIGTLAIVLTPLYMALSVTFMTDVPGLFAVVVCLYSCLRALQASNSTKATLWICFAALANVVFGSCRQISWLGVLVMVPCALWLLHRHGRILVAGCLTTLVGWAFIALSLYWFQQQPYARPEHLYLGVESLLQLRNMARELFGVVLEVPFLILPIVMAYLIVLRMNWRPYWRSLAVCGLCYALVAGFFLINFGQDSVMEPLLGDWVSPVARYSVGSLRTPGPIVLGRGIRIFLTVVSTVATFCAIAFLWRIRRRIVSDEVDTLQAEVSSRTTYTVSWNQVLVLVGPFAAAYFALLIPRSSNQLLDRYLLAFMFISGLCLIRVFQDFVQPSLPAMTKLLVGLIAIYSIGATHDMFAFYRARANVAKEILAAGVQPNMFDGGWEYNAWIALQDADYINDETTLNSPNSYVAPDPYRGLSCDGKEKMKGINSRLPHFFPRYGLSFYPNVCGGPTSLAPVSYFRWLGLRPASLYVVKYQPTKGH